MPGTPQTVRKLRIATLQAGSSDPLSFDSNQRRTWIRTCMAADGQAELLCSGWPAVLSQHDSHMLVLTCSAMLTPPLTHTSLEFTHFSYCNLKRTYVRGD
jgi:hypothetical protein